jgi:hypothetical protein
MGSNDIKLILNLLNFKENLFSSDFDFKSVTVGSHDFLTSTGSH